MKHFVLSCVLFLAGSSPLLAQNNFIFNGGSGDGFSSGTHVQDDVPQNNAIFLGGIGDGSSSALYADVPVVLNNAIFHGGASDGFAMVIVDDLALPIELLFFEGYAQSGRVHLHWRTAIEKDNDRFEIERSSSTVFEKIGWIKGGGTQFESIDYHWVDPLPFTGLSYYRLKQIDFLGKFSYSPVISVSNFSDDAHNILVYPNPTSNGSFNVSINREGAEVMEIEIMDVLGKKVFETRVHSARNFHLSLPSPCSGTFLIIFRSSAFVEVKRLIVTGL